jgi:hypothetical protein
LKHPAALAIPAIEEIFDLGGETVKLAGLKDIFAAASFSL